jgi:four helix bundle protein
MKAGPVENSPVRRFEDLLVWQKAKSLVVDIYQHSRTGALSKDFEMRDQLRSAALSTMSNIAEGFERDSKAQFLNFLNIAKASCGEVRSILYIAHDLDYVDSETFNRTRASAEELSRMIAGLANSINRSLHR